MEFEREIIGAIYVLGKAPQLTKEQSYVQNKGTTCRKVASCIDEIAAAAGIVLLLVISSMSDYVRKNVVDIPCRYTISEQRQVLSAGCLGSLDLKDN